MDNPYDHALVDATSTIVRAGHALTTAYVTPAPEAPARQGCYQSLPSLRIEDEHAPCPYGAARTSRGGARLQLDSPWGSPACQLVGVSVGDHCRNRPRLWLGSQRTPVPRMSSRQLRTADSN